MRKNPIRQMTFTHKDDMEYDLVYLQSEEWEAFYVNGDLLSQHHTVNYDILTFLERQSNYTIKKFKWFYYEPDEEFYEFPQKYSEINPKFLRRMR